MSRTNWIIVLALITTISVLLVRSFLPKRGQNPATSEVPGVTAKSGSAAVPGAGPVKKSKVKSTLESFVSVIYTPVVFYGIVVDQDGTAIPAADVEVSVSDKVGGGGSTLNAKTGPDGKFTVNTRGMSIYVKVAKSGYYGYPVREGKSRVSEEGFDYGQDFGKGVYIPDQATPFVFTLYRSSPPAELVRIPMKAIPLARNGTMTILQLRSKGSDTGKSVRLRCWTTDDRKLPDGRYDWRMEITVPGGQLQMCKEEFDFVAPEAGYENSQTIEMPASLPKRDWRDDVRRLYWIKYDDGTFGRIKVGMVAGGDHFALVDGYLNPKAGERNLEADPKLR